MAVQTDFIAAVNQIAAERNIETDEVLTAIADAIKTGFVQNFPEDSGIDIQVKIDADLGQISVVQQKTVVEKVANEYTEISLKDAKKLLKDTKEGDLLEFDVTPEGDFGRVAAQSAKQVILQKIREAERETQLKAYRDKVGQIEYAVVQRMDADSVIWEVGRAIALMPAEDRIPGEFYKSGTRHKVLLKEIRQMPRGNTLLVSRSDPKFLEALFMLEVPELLSGSIEIKNIAREAGSRSKIAVSSNVDGIDPIGSCVGQKGMRINAVTNELHFDNREEKIDIILWDAEIKQFLANAISPAEAKKVVINDEEERICTVVVADDQLSLAIGKDGQNVRLAAKLTGWKIDIVGESEAESILAEEKKAKKAVKEVKAEVKEVKEEKVEKEVKAKVAKKAVKEVKAKAAKPAAKAKKEVVKKTVVKKVAAKKPAAKKTTAAKATTKVKKETKVAAKKPAAKKAVAAKKPVAKKKAK